MFTLSRVHKQTAIKVTSCLVDQLTLQFPQLCFKFFLILLTTHTSTQSSTSLLILSRWLHLFSRENKDHRRKCRDPHQTSELSLSVSSLLLSSPEREGCPTSSLRSVLLSPLEATPHLHRNHFFNLFFLSINMFSFIGDFPLALTCSRHSRLLSFLRAKLVK